MIYMEEFHVVHWYMSSELRNNPGWIGRNHSAIGKESDNLPDMVVRNLTTITSPTHTNSRKGPDGKSILE